jgi:hypothetical protein
MKNIWMYWENTERAMPEYIKLCIQTIMKHKGNLKLNLLDQDNVGEYISASGLRPEWHYLKRAAHKADYIRTRLVYKHGGMWIDCDMAALGDIEPLFDFPDAYDYACQNIDTSIGCFIARQGCEFLKKVIDAQDKVLNDNFADFQWNGIGNELLEEFGRDYEYYQWPKWTLDEISGGKVSKLLSRNEKIEDNVDKNAVIFHFCNEALGPLIKRHVKDSQLLTSNMLISKILRKALGNDGEYNHKGGLINLFKRIWQ